MDFTDKKALVLGLGETGLSAAKWLRSTGAEVVAADSRPEPRELPGIRVHVGPFRPEILEGVDFVAISPGISLREPVVEQAIGSGIPVMGDIELFARAISGRSPAPTVIAITGSNGKSTVTTMVGKICEAAGFDTVVAGNIGVPVLDTLDRHPQVYVLELSSFQLETVTSLDAAAAAVLNLSEDHLDRHGTMASYAGAKSAIFGGHGAQVLNRDDPSSLAMRLSGRKALTFGLSAPKDESEYGIVESAGEAWLARGVRPVMKVSGLKVAGLHNAMNALAALALCDCLDIAEARAIAALEAFSGLPHRVEKVCEIGGVAYFDDSKGTNVGATVAALAGLGRKAVVILGGEGKGQDFSPLKAAVGAHARAVVLIGRDAGIIADAISGTAVPVIRAGGMEDAVARAARVAVPGDAVLLSPACASFDMFRNYSHRAEAFIAACRKREGESC